MSSRSRNEGIEVGKRVRLTSPDSAVHTVVEGEVESWDPRFELMMIVELPVDLEFYVGDGGWRVEVLP